MLSSAFFNRVFAIVVVIFTLAGVVFGIWVVFGSGIAWHWG